MQKNRNLLGILVLAGVVLNCGKNKPLRNQTLVTTSLTPNISYPRQPSTEPPSASSNIGTPTLPTPTGMSNLGYTPLPMSGAAAPKVFLLPPPPPIVDLKINGGDTSVVGVPNQPVTLSWTSQQSAPQGCSITAGVGTVRPNDSLSVVPTVSTEYTLSCDNGAGAVAKDKVSVILPEKIHATITVYQASGGMPYALYVLEPGGTRVRLASNYPAFTGGQGGPGTYSVSFLAYKESCNSLRFQLVYEAADAIARDTSNPADFPYMNLTKTGTVLDLVFNDNNDTTDKNYTYKFRDVHMALTLPTYNFNIASHGLPCG